MNNHNRSSLKKNVARWKRLGTLGVLSSYLLLFSEWLFLITMPSFLSSTPFVSNFKTLLISGGMLAAAVAIPILVLAAIDLSLATRKPTKLLLYAASTLLAVIVAVLILLLVDNFTYTLFKFGIVSTAGWARGIYACGFLILVVYLTVKIAALAIRSKNASAGFRYAGFLAAGIMSVSLILAAFEYDYRPSLTRTAVNGSGAQPRPNILLIGGDGLNAEKLPGYGYDRNTTPFIAQRSPSFLMAENAFTNAPHTYTSILSILTGRLSPENGILSGEQAYLHLPGLLRQAGYYNVQIGVSNWVDANKMNILNGFDVVNQRSVNDSPFFQFSQALGFAESSYFQSVVLGRVSDRLAHIFYLRPMENVYKVVTESNEQVNLDDQAKIDEVIELFSTADRPLFVQVHLMGTHGPVFFPRQAVYSAGEQQTEAWMSDYYDDAVLDFDAYVKQVFDALALSGDLENTLIVIYTDHNMMYLSDQRIPLFFHFPGGDHSGVIKNNVQNMDIAPTLLDYLGIDPPEWMVGGSMLKGEPPATRLILSGNNPHDLRIVHCQRWYRFDVLSGVWFTGTVEGHTEPCAGGDSSTAAELPVEIARYLAAEGITINEIPEDAQAYADFIGLISRGQLADALLRAKYGPTYAPLPAEGVFTDVPLSDPYAPWIEQAFREGILGSCLDSPLSYCPQEIVTRGDVALSLLRAVEGKDYQPPPAQGLFEDVPVASPRAPWIEELYQRRITSGCSNPPLLYCPEDSLSREALVIFTGRAFPAP